MYGRDSAPTGCAMAIQLGALLIPSYGMSGKQKVDSAKSQTFYHIDDYSHAVDGR